MTLRNNLESARLLERWLSDHAGRMRAQAALARDAFNSSAAKDVAMRLAGVHEKAAALYENELAVLRVEIGGKA